MAALANTPPRSEPAPVTVIPAEPRSVIFHLSPYAKGCETAPVGDRRRGFSVHGRRPGQALAALFDRLEISARHVAVTAMVNGDLAIHPKGEPHKPWAFVWNGLTCAEAITALTALQAMPPRAAR